MQEEVEDRTVNLAVSTTKFAAGKIIEAARTVLAGLKDDISAEDKPSGKQSVKDLIGQNQGVSNIDISKTDLKGFEKYARKYGIDYAVTKDAAQNPPKYMVFFKGHDRDAMDAAFSEYTAKVLKRTTTRKSVLKKLDKMKVKAASIHSRVKNLYQGRDR